MPVRRHPVAASMSIGALNALPVDRELVKRLSETYSRVRAQEMRFAEVFYAKLFAAAPNIRSLFKGDLGEQARKLTASLDAVVQNLEDPSGNASMLAELGRRHAGYGAKPEHYALVGTLLVDAMREVLGADAEERGLLEWRMALKLIGDQMSAAGSSQR